LKNFCSRCGSRIKATNRFCENCGAPLSAEISREELNSVMVKELDSGDIIFYRPASDSPLPSEHGSSPLVHSPNDGPDTIDIQLENILPIIDTPAFHKSNGEIPPVLFESELRKPLDNVLPAMDSPVFDKPLSAPMDDIFSPLPLMEELKLTDIEYFLKGDAESSETFSPPPEPSVLDECRPLAEEKLTPSPEVEEPGPKPDSKLIVEDQVDESVRRFINDEPLQDSDSDFVSVLGWIGIIFLLMIPGLNLLLIIIWALGGCRKKQKARFARALLVVILIIGILVLLSLTLLKDHINTAISNLLTDGAPSEFALSLLKGIIDTAENWGLNVWSLFSIA